MSRSLTIEEIDVLERQGCTADDWAAVCVADDFEPRYVRHTTFAGDVVLGTFNRRVETVGGVLRHAGINNATLCDVTIGDNCLIENICCQICRCDIGENCYIANVGIIASIDGATYGQNNAIAVLNEAGDGNVFAYDGLTSQMAAFMVAANKTVRSSLHTMVTAYATRYTPERGSVGDRVKIVNTREIMNCVIGDDSEIDGASRLTDCTIKSSPDAATFVGSDVICENTIVQAGASLTDGTHINNCFVGEACYIENGFSAESSVFFANSFLANGEACAAFCGPFTVSHHKSTLLIGGSYSFYNAGSATNYSNHAYKLGPIHYGSLERGSKTASGAHLLWPAHIGAFSVCLGKIQDHPNTTQLPFSYIIGDADGTTHIVPGRNLTTVGTYRDIHKWPKRDLRPLSGRRSVLNYDWLNPIVAAEMVAGRHLLDTIREEQGDDADVYFYEGCTIKGSSLRKGCELYDMGIMLYLREALCNHDSTLPHSTIGTGTWTDLAGLLAPTTETDQLAQDIANGSVANIETVEDRLADIHNHYDEYKWAFTYKLITTHLGIDTLTDDELRDIKADAEVYHNKWLAAIKSDANREHTLGDMDDTLLADFVSSLV